MEQNGDPSNKPKHLWSINPQQRRQGYKIGKRQSFQQGVLGKLDTTNKLLLVSTPLWMKLIQGLMPAHW